MPARGSGDPREADAGPPSGEHATTLPGYDGCRSGRGRRIWHVPPADIRQARSTNAQRRAGRQASGGTRPLVLAASSAPRRCQEVATRWMVASMSLPLTKAAMTIGTRLKKLARCCRAGQDQVLRVVARRPASPGGWDRELPIDVDGQTPWVTSVDLELERPPPAASPGGIGVRAPTARP